MNKITLTLLSSTVLLGTAAAAYMPVLTGEKVKEQLEAAIARSNASQGSSGVETEVIQYNKGAYSSDITTRLTFKDADFRKKDGTAPFVDLRHTLSHGFSSAKFESEILITESMKPTLEKIGGTVPLHFDGVLSPDKATINTYIDGFTMPLQHRIDDQDITVELGKFSMKPGIVKVDYRFKDNSYTSTGVWNGALLNSSDDTFTWGTTDFNGNGRQLTDLLWSYNSNISISEITLTNPGITIKSEGFKLKDSFKLTPNTENQDSLNYAGNWSIDRLYVERDEQPLYDIQPAGLSYTLSGPTVEHTEALMQIVDSPALEQMSPEELEQRVLPLVTQVLNAAKLNLHDINLVTSQGRVNAGIKLEFDASPEEVLQVIQFPMAFPNHLKLQGNASVSKALFGPIPIFRMVAMQLNQLGAYQENEKDMLINASLNKGQLIINNTRLQ